MFWSHFCTPCRQNSFKQNPLIQSVSQTSVLKAISLRFHDNCGKNIKLSNNNQTAQRTSLDKYDGIVMSLDPMLTNKLYQVRQMYLSLC